MPIESIFYSTIIKKKRFFNTCFLSDTRRCSMAYISLQHVVKRYQMGEVVIPAVDDVSFEI